MDWVIGFYCLLGFEDKENLFYLEVVIVEIFWIFFVGVFVFYKIIVDMIL